MPAPVANPLSLGELQLERLQRGALDEYLADEETFLDSCRSVVDGRFEPGEQQVALARLVRLMADIDFEIERLKSDTTARMRQLGERRRLAEAYYAARPPEALTHREM